MDNARGKSPAEPISRPCLITAEANAPEMRSFLCSSNVVHCSSDVAATIFAARSSIACWFADVGTGEAVGLCAATDRQQPKTTAKAWERKGELSRGSPKADGKLHSRPSFCLGWTGLFYLRASDWKPPWVAALLLPKKLIIIRIWLTGWPHGQLPESCAGGFAQH